MTTSNSKSDLIGDDASKTTTNSTNTNNNVQTSSSVTATGGGNIVESNGSYNINVLIPPADSTTASMNPQPSAPLLQEQGNFQ